MTSSPITITTIELPSAPLTGPSSQCGTAVPTAFAVGGSTGNYRWYLTSTGGTAIPGEFNGTLLNYTISSPTMFYVAITNGTCESARTSVFADVTFPDAVQATADNNSVCVNTPVLLSAVQTGSSNNYTFNWSSSTSNGSGVTGKINGQSITMPTIAGNYTYTVNASDGGCATVSQEHNSSTHCLLFPQ